MQASRELRLRTGFVVVLAVATGESAAARSLQRVACDNARALVYSGG